MQFKKKQTTNGGMLWIPKREAGKTCGKNV
jgi:hypothetical protein